MTLLWSTDDSPRSIIPSTGTRSPASTRTTSPISTSSSATSSSPPSRSTRACSGWLATKPAIAPLARSTVQCSIPSPISMMNMTSAAAKYSPIQTAAPAAMAIVRWDEKCPWSRSRIAWRMSG